MKIIQAMKKIKENKQKIVDLKQKVQATSAHLSYETPMYQNVGAQVASWLQSCEDLSQENIRLLTAIQRTNLATSATIKFSNGLEVTKTLAEWVWRRREYAAMDASCWLLLTDRGLKEGNITLSTGVNMEAKIVRNYDPLVRDMKISMYKSEPSLIDAELEVINAITDLIE